MAVESPGWLVVAHPGGRRGGMDDDQSAFSTSAVPGQLGSVSAAGVPFWVWGLIALDPWITAFGLAVQMLGKLWFLDRMALLYDDVQGSCVPDRNRPE